MPNSIYYNPDLKPIPVNLVWREGKEAVIELKGKHFTVPAHRIISLNPTPRKNQYAQTRPDGYLTVAEYCSQHGITVTKKECKSYSAKCGWECRRTGISSWGSRQSLSYPVKVLATVFKVEHL